MELAAIIVNFRTPQAAIEAALTLDNELSAYQSRILVIDNDSQDGSLAVLRGAFPPGFREGRIIVMDSGHNGGYGYGINVGVREILSWKTQPTYIHILNPDAHVDPGSMQRLIGFMDEHPEAGLAGSTVHGPAGEIQAQAFRFPTLWSEIEGTARLRPLSWALESHQVSLSPAASTEVDWVPGTSMLVRREVFDSAGLFDQGFFLYFEEVDFALRVKQAGWKVFYVADAGISHIGSLATGMADESRRMPAYWFQARRRYFVKHHGRLYGAACDAAWLSGHALYLAKLPFKPRAPRSRPGLWWDFARYSLRNVWREAPVAPQNAHLSDNADKSLARDAPTEEPPATFKKHMMNVAHHALSNGIGWLSRRVGSGQGQA